MAVRWSTCISLYTCTLQGWDPIGRFGYPTSHWLLAKLYHILFIPIAKINNFHTKYPGISDLNIDNFPPNISCIYRASWLAKNKMDSVKIVCLFLRLVAGQKTHFHGFYITLHTLKKLFGTIIMISVIMIISWELPKITGAAPAALWRNCTIQNISSP